MGGLVMHGMVRRARLATNMQAAWRSYRVNA
jgi:hypothetical protein